MQDDYDFFIHFSVPMHSIQNASREYIFRYLKFLPTVNQWTTRTDYEKFLKQSNNPNKEQPSSNFHLSEGEGSDKDWTITATGYEVYYAWSYIETVSYPGQYTPPGWTVPLKTNQSYSKLYEFGKPDYAEGIHEVHGPDAVVATTTSDTQYHDYAVFTHQSRDAEGNLYYEQVIIMAPSMMYVINTPISDGGDIQYIDVELFPEDPEEDSEFRWPIHISTLKKVSRMHREAVLQDALCATVFVIDRQKVKWYQKTFFKWLIIIIVIVVMIVTWQYELLPTVWGLAGAALAEGAIGTAIAWAALYVVMVFALGFMISFAGSLIGGTWGKIFVIVAMLYMAGGTSMFSNIGQSFSQMSANFGWGTATNFLNAIGPVINITKIVVEDRAMAKLEHKMDDLAKTKREKYDELQNAWDAFGPPPEGIDPLDLVNALNTQWYMESPSNYYERSLNANPGILGYDVINRFTELALTIPEHGNPGDFIQGVFRDMEAQRGAV